MLTAKIDALIKLVEQAVSKIETHVNEADKPGGVRERLLLAEASLRVQKEAISTIKQSYWKVGIACAIVGGLIARLAPDLIWDVIKQAFKYLH